MLEKKRGLLKDVKIVGGETKKSERENMESIERVVSVYNGTNVVNMLTHPCGLNPILLLLLLIFIEIG